MEEQIEEKVEEKPPKKKKKTKKAEKPKIDIDSRYKAFLRKGGKQ